MPRRLYSRIYLNFLLVLLVVGLFSISVFYMAVRMTHRRGNMSRLAMHTAALFAERLSQPEALARLGQHLADEFDIDITVRDAQGKVLFVTGPELPRLRPEDEARLGEGPRSINLQLGGGWFMAAPLYPPPPGRPPLRDPGDALLPRAPHWPPRRWDRPPLIGVLEVSLMRQFSRRGLVAPLVSVALLLVAAALGTIPLARRISRPVEQLTEANGRLGGGDLGYRIAYEDHGQGDELLALQRSWNEMAERIENLVRGHKELLANVSHELRSPLTRVRVALALLDDQEDQADPARRERLADVEADLGELERLIDDVLTTSRLSALGLPLRRQPVAVAELQQQLAQRAAATPGVTLQVAPAEPGLTLSADGALLKRALWNLIENAAKYGAPPITLSANRLGARDVPLPAAQRDAAATWLALAVSDEGPGIPAAERRRVLEPFYRGDRARTPAAGVGGGGFGLGLTLAQRIAEAHGGALRLTDARPEGSEDGAAPASPADPRGCRVTLLLPIMDRD